MSVPLRVERAEDLERPVTAVRHELVRPPGLQLVPGGAGSLSGLDREFFEFFAWSEPIRRVPARTGLITPQEFCTLDGLCEVGIRWFQHCFPDGYEGRWLQLAYEPVVPLGGRGWLASHAPDLPSEQRVRLALASDRPLKWFYAVEVGAPTLITDRAGQAYLQDLAFTAQRRHEKAGDAGARQRPPRPEPSGWLARLLRPFECK